MLRLRAIQTRKGLDGFFYGAVMIEKLLIVIAYLILTLVVGFIFRKRARRSSTEFFLAGRSVPRILLFFTMAATNFSAFTVFGFSGAGYRIGYAFYPVMGFGTGFMALALYIIGSKILILSKKRGYVTPSDFIIDRYNSSALKILVSTIMIVFTLPYISLQAIASGKSLNSLVGIPYLSGALLITIFVVLYVGLGGLRSIVWTDLIQGLMMILFVLAAFIIISRKSGGFAATNEAVFARMPELFSRPGGNEAMGMGIWFGYMFLWFVSVPMAPQIFQRFMVAKDRDSFKATIILYPIITTFLFFLTVSIGVMGRFSFPALPAAESDAIFPLLLGRYTGVFLSTLLLTGSLAALMSTMDSQLLSLTSMITIDFLKIKKKQVLKQRLIIAILGLLGFLIAIRPPQTILDFISDTTFRGLSVLAPTLIGGLYWRRANRYGALASIIVGEAVVSANYIRLVSFPGIRPVVPIVCITTVVFVVVSLLTRLEGENTEIVFNPDPNFVRWTPAFLLLFVLGNDFWAWAQRPHLMAGLPLWIWYYFALGLLVSGVFALALRKAGRRIEL
jgi:SSS family solute:Na+ symporter